VLKPRLLFDHRGEAVRLGAPLASGGEGAVFTLAADPTRLAKLYHRPPDADKVAKLRHMAGAADAGTGGVTPPLLTRVAAWPTATLHDAPGGLMVGFLMPRFDGYRPLHTLYSPAHRRAAFPHADWAFLVHTAMNCAAAFDFLHGRGVVVGDVNQSNVLVGDQALVCLIDCDSFQVRAGERVFRCEVGVGPFTPPELQGASFRALDRTTNHDRFGLAVLLFHLLFMGRHPFAGRYLGAGDMPLERAIEEFRFVYSEAGPDTSMGPPPFALPLRAVGPQLASLFERAFDEGSEVPGARPTPGEWHAALGAFLPTLRPCPREPGHRTPAHMPECPWCAVMKAGGPDFFLGTGPGGDFEVNRPALDVVWSRVEEVPRGRFRLEEPPRPAEPAPGRLPPRAWLGRRVAPRLQVAGLWGALLAMLAVSVSCAGLPFFPGAWTALGWSVVAFFVVGYALGVGQGWAKALEDERRRRHETARQAAGRVTALRREAREIIDQAKKEGARQREELARLRERIESLQAEFDAARPRREGGPEPGAEGRQREQFLRGQFIAESKISGIGPGRAALLASYGVETAWDVSEEALLPIKGIGKVLRDNLLAWKASVLAGFRFDPERAATGEPPRELVLKYKLLEEELRNRLQKGVFELESLAARTEERLAQVRDLLAAALRDAAQARADARAAE
jgi:DNA-binding helix-hairpin-helix protein with protein kinase domain